MRWIKRFYVPLIQIVIFAIYVSIMTSMNDLLELDGASEHRPLRPIAILSRIL